MLSSVKHFQEKKFKRLGFDAKLSHLFFFLNSFLLQKRRIKDELPSTVKNMEVNLHQRDSSSHFSGSNKLEARQKCVPRTFNN